MFSIRAYQAIKITRLKFVRILSENLQVADAIVTCSSLKDIAKGKGTECGISAGATSSNGKSVSVNLTACYKLTCAMYTVVHIHDAPLTL